MEVFSSTATRRFWECLAALPPDVQDDAFKQYAQFRANPWHPSLRLKPVFAMWSVRVNRGYRALSKREGNHFTWFWIGTHEEYARILSR